MLIGIGELFRALAISHLLFLSALLVRDERADRSRWIFFSFIGGVVSYLLRPVLLDKAAPPWLIHPVFMVSAAIPFFFWLLARTHFTENTRVSRTTWGFGAALVLFTYMPFTVRLGGPTGTAMLSLASSELWHLTPKLIGGAFVFHALDGV